MSATLITGASSGLGKSFAKLYGKLGNNLVLVATNLEALEQTKKEVLELNPNIEIDVLKCDFSENANLAKIHDFTSKKALFIDRLINNAGFGDQCDFVDMDIAKQVKMVEVNCNAPMVLISLYLKEMVKQNKGEIINVCSVASFYPGPHMSTYHASKAFLFNLTEGIRHELKGTNIKVLSLCPGPFESKFVEKAHNDYVFKVKKPVTSDYVAKIGYEGLKKNKGLAIVGFTNKLERFASRFASLELMASSSSKALSGKK